jgi:putative lipase involved disintegration of autophagic bodies
MVKAFAGDNADIEVKGFSLGGAIATYAGICNEIPTTTLCPLPVSPFVWKSLINEKGENLTDLIKNVTIHPATRTRSAS